MHQSSAPIRRRVANSQGATTHVYNIKQAQSTYKRRKRDLLRRINYGHTFTVTILPFFAMVIWMINSSLPSQSIIISSIIYFNFTLLAFTTGYHKYFAHNSFQTSSLLIEYYFIIFGNSLGLGSVRWWATMHRAHHQYTDDTDKDPYSIKRGILWAHWGWLIKKPKVNTFYQNFMQQEFPLPRSELNVLEIPNEVNEMVGKSTHVAKSELEGLKYKYDYKLLAWQDNWYFVIFMITSVIIPGIWGKFLGSFTDGIVFIGILRMFCAQQCILSTESICHKQYAFNIPTQPFNDTNSSTNCNNPIISLLTYGQASQNFHHEFPHDYRSNSSLLLFDPTKWFIWTLSVCGLVYDLCITPKDLIVQLKLQQQQLVINRVKSQLNWGTPISKLPIISAKEFNKIIASSTNSDRCYIVIRNIIHDITPFMEQHPGGVQLLKASIGKDATKAFFGGVYNHSTAANNLLATMRIGVLDQGNKEDVWRRAVVEEVKADLDGPQIAGSYKTAEAA